MCGIAGFLDPKQEFSSVAEDVAAKMSQALFMRGPDAGGVWTDRASGIALAHRRLSIVDLSPAGAQPMTSSSGRFVLVFNGEIYNHMELRAELTESWRGHSDTETLLAMIEAHGLKATLKKTIGMFAIALWDRRERTLTLARDRVGEKPLYYGWQNGILLFASELKALRCHPAFNAQIDRGVLALFLQQKYIPAPYSIYHGIKKLMPGSLLVIKDSSQEAQLEYYWSAKTEIETSLASPFQGSATESIDQLEQLIRASVSRQMMADVPLGAFLSGGIDSSTVVGIMQSLSARPVKTFTIGFNEKDFNEAEHAKAVAKHLGTQHEELYVTAADALELIPQLPKVYCEPFADKSQIPTMLLSRMTRKHVTVALSGDGGDELFGGYTRYFESMKWMKKVARVPRELRDVTAVGVRALSVFDRKWRQYADLLETRSESEFYQRRVTKWQGAEEVVLGAKIPPTIFSDESQQPKTDSFFHRMMAIDFMSYLPDDIMCKVDRAAMANSLETRIPLLSQDIISFAWSLPLELKTQGGVGKWPLRQVLDRYVPRELIDRPKRGFNVPIPQWLRGELRPWAEELLSEKRLRDEGFFDVAKIRQQWSEHLSGRHNRTESLWSVLMFQAWLEKDSDKS